MKFSVFIKLTVRFLRVKMGICSIIAIVFLCSSSVFAQIITVVQSSDIIGDSSYYHILRVNENEFWLGGEYGLLKKINNEEKLEEIIYPNNGNHILAMELWGRDKVILVCDKGTIYQYCTVTYKWEFTNIPEFNNSAFYNITTVNDSVAFICGGNSKVADGKKAIPYGFILKTIDKGLNWQKIYKNNFKMIWDILYDNNQLYAITYSPLGSNVIVSEDLGKSWKKTGIKNSGLYHDIEKSDNLYFVGGEVSKNKSNGIITLIENQSDIKLKGTGIFWELNAGSLFILATACNGILAFKKRDEYEWNAVKSPIAKHLYSSKFIDPSSAYIVGREKTILKLKWEDSNNKNGNKISGSR